MGPVGARDCRSGAGGHRHAQRSTCLVIVNGSFVFVTVSELLRNNIDALVDDKAYSFEAKFIMVRVNLNH